MKTKVRVIDRKSLEKAMELYTKAKNNRSELNARMEERINAIRSKYVDRINLFDEECDQLATEMLDYAREHRDAIFPKGTKHIELTSGTIGYKQGRPSLGLRDGHTWASALTALQEDRSGKEYLRIKYEIDKARLLCDRDKPKTARLIDRIGLRINDDEQFYLTTN